MDLFVVIDVVKDAEFHALPLPGGVAESFANRWSLSPVCVIRSGESTGMIGFDQR
jgi:hypothetical protein